MLKYPNKQILFRKINQSINQSVNSALLVCLGGSQRQEQKQKQNTISSNKVLSRQKEAGTRRVPVSSIYVLWYPGTSLLTQRQAAESEGFREGLTINE